MTRAMLVIARNAKEVIAGVCLLQMQTFFIQLS